MFENPQVQTVFWTGFFVCISIILTIIGQIVVKRFDISLNRKTQKKKEMDIYYPLLACLYDMDKRINSIFNNIHEDWLSSDVINQIKTKKGFAEDPTDNSGYFFISLMYRFGRFFGTLRTIETIKNELKNSKKKKSWICEKWQKLWEKSNDKSDTTDDYIHRVTSLFQSKFFFDECYKGQEWYKRNEPKQSDDTRDGVEIHTLVQETIGEMMIADISNYRLKTFKEFCDAYTIQGEENATFRIWFSYIEHYLSDLKLEKSDGTTQNPRTLEVKCKQSKDVRPLRLKAIQYWCRKLIANIKENYPDFEVQFKENLSADDLFAASEETENKKQLYVGTKLTNAIKDYTPKFKK